MYEVSVTREFCSAHFLRDYAGKCAQLHGHNWKVEVSYRRPRLQKNGILVDFVDIGRVLDSLLDQLDHHVINEVAPFGTVNPTSENLCRWLYEQIKERMPEGSPKPYRVRVWETPDACASYWEEEP